jgi:hypothetical protein
MRFSEPCSIFDSCTDMLIYPQPGHHHGLIPSDVLVHGIYCWPAVNTKHQARQLQYYSPSDSNIGVIHNQYVIDHQAHLARPATRPLMHSTSPRKASAPTVSPLITSGAMQDGRGQVYLIGHLSVVHGRCVEKQEEKH